MVAEALKPQGPSSSLAVRENFVRRRDFVAAQVHILLVCADNKERFTLTNRLKRLEYAVTAVASARAAIALLHRGGRSGGSGTAAKARQPAKSEGGAALEPMSMLHADDGAHAPSSAAHASYQLLMVDVSAHRPASIASALLLLRWATHQLNLRELARVVSSYEMPTPLVVEAMRAGAADYLHKPFSDAELVRLPSTVSHAQNLRDARETNAPDAGPRTAASILFRRWAASAKDAHARGYDPAEVDAVAEADEQADMGPLARPAARPPTPPAASVAAQKLLKQVSRSLASLPHRFPDPKRDPALPLALQAQHAHAGGAAGAARRALASEGGGSSRVHGGGRALSTAEGSRPAPLLDDVEWSLIPHGGPSAEPAEVRILIVERDERRASAMAEVLGALGFSDVRHSRNVKDAIAMADAAIQTGRNEPMVAGEGTAAADYRTGFHLALVDVVRDEASARLLYSELVARALLLPLVGLTESKDITAITKAMRLGCVDVLQGPPFAPPRVRALCSYKLTPAELAVHERELTAKRETDQFRESSAIAAEIAAGGDGGARRLADARAAGGSVSDEQAEAALFAAISAMHHAAMEEREARKAAQRAAARRAISDRHRPATAAEKDFLLAQTLSRAGQYGAHGGAGHAHASAHAHGPAAGRRRSALSDAAGASPSAAIAAARTRSVSPSGGRVAPSKRLPHSHPPARRPPPPTPPPRTPAGGAGALPPLLSASQLRRGLVLRDRVLAAQDVGAAEGAGEEGEAALSRLARLGRAAAAAEKLTSGLRASAELSAARRVVVLLDTDEQPEAEGAARPAPSPAAASRRLRRGASMRAKRAQSHRAPPGASPKALRRSGASAPPPAAGARRAASSRAKDRPALAVTLDLDDEEAAALAANAPRSLLGDYGVRAAHEAEADDEGEDGAEGGAHRGELLRWRNDLLASPTRKLTPSRSPARQASERWPAEPGSVAADISA